MLYKATVTLCKATVMLCKAKITHSESQTTRAQKQRIELQLPFWTKQDSRSRWSLPNNEAGTPSSTAETGSVSRTMLDENFWEMGMSIYWLSHALRCHQASATWTSPQRVPWELCGCPAGAWRPGVPGFPPPTPSWGSSSWPLGPGLWHLSRHCRNPSGHSSAHGWLWW